MATKRKKKKKMSGQKRVSAALSRWIKKQNPALKKATHVRIQKLKDGSIKIKPNAGPNSRRKTKKHFKKYHPEYLAEAMDYQKFLKAQAKRKRAIARRDK